MNNVTMIKIPGSGQIAEVGYDDMHAELYIKFNKGNST